MPQNMSSLHMDKCKSTKAQNLFTIHKSTNNSDNIIINGAILSNLISTQIKENIIF